MGVGLNVSSPVASYESSANGPAMRACSTLCFTGDAGRSTFIAVCTLTAFTRTYPRSPDLPSTSTNASDPSCCVGLACSLSAALLASALCFCGEKQRCCSWFDSLPDFSSTSTVSSTRPSDTRLGVF
ncbi:unnamed protein product [Linum trigynum]|uniref:Uncharacterized protein n=1 Tax=Linum trigynum TaxID=586398 RepID=A0AAV2D9P5_9ROSI